MRLACFSKTEKKNVSQKLTLTLIPLNFKAYFFYITSASLEWFYDDIFHQYGISAVVPQTPLGRKISVFLLSGFGLDYGVIGGEDMRRICFDPWLLTKITDRKGIILNKNQLQYLNEFIKPNLWNYQLFAWNTWETTWAYMPQENKNWNTGCRLWEKSPYIPCKIANFNTIIVFHLRKFAICIDF